MTKLILFAFFASTNAFATNIDQVKLGAPACYGREYSEKHMSENSLQTVKKIFMKFSKMEDETNPDYFLLNIEAEIKNPKLGKSESETEPYRKYHTAMFCQKGALQMECSIDCDGGSAQVNWNKATANKEILFKNKGFVLYGGCGEDEDPENSVWLEPKKGGDDLFKLNALPEEFCQN